MNIRINIDLPTLGSAIEIEMEKVEVSGTGYLDQAEKMLNDVYLEASTWIRSKQLPTKQ